MAVLFCASKGNALVPTSKASAMEMEKLPRNVPLRIDAKQPRNGKQHRLFWAFATYVADALNDGPTPSQWDSSAVTTMLKVATGHVHWMPASAKDRKRLGVSEIPVPKSISFAAMDGQEFGAFMDAAFRYVQDELCRWIEESPHWDDIQSILRESAMIGESA